MYMHALQQLMLMSEPQRRYAITQHAPSVFDPRFVAFVEAKVAQAQAAAQPQGLVGHLMSGLGLNPVADLLAQRRDAVAAVWRSMKAVYLELQAQSLANAAATHRRAPRSTSGGGHVFSGGTAPTTSDNDHAEEARRLGDIERDHWEYVQRENDNVDALIEHQRIEDQTHYDTYVDPGPSYGSSYDSYSYSTPSYDSYDY